MAELDTMNAESFEQLLRNQIPIAWIAGVRFESYHGETFKTCVRHDFLNQNPFGSIFWAVEGMAAEFAGGMMLTDKINATGKSIATLVVKNETIFTKKARGKIVFSCNEGTKIDQEIQKAIDTNTPSVFDLKSIGTDEEDDVVAEFVFTWSIKLRE